MVQYTPDGRIDRSFGDRGRVHIPYDVQRQHLRRGRDHRRERAGSSIGGALQMPTSGQLLVGGLRANGTPDPRFGVSGFDELVVGGGPYTGAESLSLDPEGRLVLAGIYGDPRGDSDRFAVVRMRLTSPQP